VSSKKFPEPSDEERAAFVPTREQKTVMRNADNWLYWLNFHERGERGGGLLRKDRKDREERINDAEV